MTFLFIVVLFSLMKLQKIYFRYVLWFEDGSISSVCVDNYTAGLGFHQWSRNKKWNSFVSNNWVISFVCIAIADTFIWWSTCSGLKGFIHHQAWSPFRWVKNKNNGKTRWKVFLEIHLVTEYCHNFYLKSQLFYIETHEFF